jgi:glycosyltransferase involved in cell wall biosynthesis
MKSISVIVPTYNCGRFIAEAIDSILRQTVEPEQIIVVDDGSTDDTEQVVRRYADPRIEYIKQPNAGIASARNTGLKATRCEFVTFLDADDRWRPQFIERMHAFLAEDATIVCAFSNFIRFEHTIGKVLGDQFRLYPEPLRKAGGRLPREQAFSTLVACGEIPAYLQVMMFRRALISGIRFDESLRIAEDSNFALKAFLQGDVMFTDEVLAEVRRHENNVTRDYHEIVVHTLASLKALAPHVTRADDIAAYHGRLVRAHCSAAIYQTRSGRVGAGLRSYWDGLRVPGSSLRKIKAAARMVLVLPRGLVASRGQ